MGPELCRQGRLAVLHRALVGFRVSGFFAAKGFRVYGGGVQGFRV